MILIDTSVLLAIIKKESNYKELDFLLSDISMSVVNLAEVYGSLGGYGYSTEEIKDHISYLVPHFWDFDLDIAMLTGELRKNTKYLGLSLGDRACIATAIKHRLPVYTADKIWSQFQHDGLEIVIIR